MAPARATPTRRRHIGYGVHVLVDAVLLWLINVAPGWEVLTFLTQQAVQVVGIVNAALLLDLVLNLTYLLRESSLTKGLGDAATATLELIVLARLFVIFPFSLPSAQWEIPLRIALGVGMVASFIGVVAGWGRVARALHVRSHGARR